MASERPAAEAPTPEELADRRRRTAFFAVWGTIALGVIMVFRDVLMPFALAVIVAYVLAPLVRWLERLVVDRPIPRWVAVLLVYVVLIAGLASFITIGAPRLVREIEVLIGDMPRAVSTVRNDWLPGFERWLSSAIGEEAKATAEPAPEPPAPEPALPGIEIRQTLGGYELILPPEGIAVRKIDDGYVLGRPRPPPTVRPALSVSITETLRSMTEYTEEFAVTFLKTAQRLIAAIVRGVFTFVIMLMLSAYFIVTSKQIFGFFRSLLRPERKPVFDRLLRRIDVGLSGVVRGQLLIALINGALSAVLFWALDLKYWPILTLIATVLSIIPIFGSIISTVPAAVIALQQGFGWMLLTIGLVIVIHQFEANILNPKILGDAAQVHPVLVVFALLAGEHLFGVVGAILAVPVLSIAQSLFLHFREVVFGVPAPRRSTRPPPNAEPA